jgi:hypothetical protein
LEAFLASGGNSRVYQGETAQGEKVVVKYPMSEDRDFSKELETLRRLRGRGVDEHIPQVLEESTANCLVLVPLATPLSEAASFTSKEFVRLFDILLAAHRAKIAHCDVSWSNIFVKQNGQLFLNDWGSATKLGQPSGPPTPMFLSERLLRATKGGDRTSAPGDDFAALLHCLYFRIYGGFGEACKAARGSDRDASIDGLLMFWKNRFGDSGWWADMRTLADEGTETSIAKLKHEVHFLFRIFARE